MALSHIYKRYHLCKYVCPAFVVLRKKSMFVELDADVLDDFTTLLMQKKTDKWANFKIKRQFPLTVQAPVTVTQILGDKLNETTIGDLNTIFQNLVDENELYKILTLLEECIAYRKIPSDIILSNTLRYFSQMANIEGIKKIQELCSLINPDFIKANSEFKHYVAEATWIKGNISKAIGMFEEVYHENNFLRRRIRLMLKTLISDAVTNRSEAVLINMVTFAENLVKKYGDYYMMTCLWQSCFLSEWFSDQKVSLELIKKNNGLCKMLVNQIPYVVSVSLKHNKTDPVYRLLEILLEYNMKLEYSVVLVALFDYRYRQGDLRSCLEILNWSIKYKVMLPTIQHEKFLKLLLKCGAAETSERHRTPNYDLKF